MKQAYFKVISYRILIYKVRFFSFSVTSQVDLSINALNCNYSQIIDLNLL